MISIEVSAQGVDRGGVGGVGDKSEFAERVDRGLDCGAEVWGLNRDEAICDL